MTAAELAGGFGGPSVATQMGIEESFRRHRLEPLPAATRRLLQLAAADPVGEPLLVWRAAAELGIEPAAATPAVDEGLFDIGAQVRFLHPCMRAAAYRSASAEERQALHAALAHATDPQVDPDRRAWHLAQATAGPDEQVADELERSAGRAQARGGLAAAAAFLDSAAKLTADPARRADRLLAAARAQRDAGALDAALELLGAVEAGPVDAHQAAEIEKLRGEICFDQRRIGEAARRLGDAARQFEPCDAELARVTHLEALGAAMWAGQDGLEAAAESALGAPPGLDPPGTVDVLLDAFATRVTQGYAAGAPALRRAVDAVRALEPGDDVGRWLWLTGVRAGGMAALEIWDDDSWHALAERQARVARDMGALVRLQFALQFLAKSHLLAGDLAAAGRANEEDRAIAAATGRAPVGYTTMTLAAWRGHETAAVELIDRQRGEASALGIGRLAVFATYATAVLYNGLGRYDVARDAAREAFEEDYLGFTPFVVPEVAEAASRTGDAALLQATTDWLADRTAATPSDWALGMEARVRALGTDGDGAEVLYLESIDRLGRTRLRGGGRARPAALRGVAPAREPAGRRAPAAARRPRGVPGDGRGGVRRPGAARAAGHRREGAQAARRHPRRAHAAGGADRPAGARRAHQPRDRRRALPQSPHRGVASEEGVHQAGDHFAPGAARRAPGPGTRGRCRLDHEIRRSR